jgi:hypothetical protein
MKYKQRGKQNKHMHTNKYKRRQHHNDDDDDDDDDDNNNRIMKSSILWNITART